MRRFKIIDGTYITAIGIGNCGVEISQDEYSEIFSTIQAKPYRQGTKDYRLRTDLTWVECQINPPQPEPDPDSEEILSILTGGE